MRVPHCSSIEAQKHLQILLSALLLWSSIQVQCSVQGRSLLELQEIMSARRLPAAAKEGEVLARALIGSTPPRCDAIRCISCGRCEAVQVPAIPQQQQDKKQELASWRTAAYYGGDHGSNYKPMKWRCKCGDRIFNP